MTIKLVCYTDVFASPHAIYDHFVIGIRYSAGICIGNHDYRKLYRLNAVKIFFEYTSA